MRALYLFLLPFALTLLLFGARQIIREDAPPSPIHLPRDGKRNPEATGRTWYQFELAADICFLVVVNPDEITLTPVNKELC